MKGTPYSIRNNEFYGDMAEWLRTHSEDNESDMRRLKRNLRIVREEELTARQRQLLQMRYEEGMTVSAIARELGVDKSTVSRTITRAKARIRRALRYSL